jgi:uncharacterized protein with PIN domain
VMNERFEELRHEVMDRDGRRCRLCNSEVVATSELSPEELVPAGNLAKAPVKAHPRQLEIRCRLVLCHSLIFG